VVRADSGLILPHEPHPGPGIDKIVAVMMENRSFDRYLDWVPGADGVQARFGFLSGGLRRARRGATNPNRTSVERTPFVDRRNNRDPGPGAAGARRRTLSAR
jgi:hypothetical protein